MREIKFFIGVPLSQNDFNYLPLRDVLCDIASEHEGEINDYDDSELQGGILVAFNKLKNWFNEHQQTIDNLGLKIQSHYNGDGDYPMIFGIYISDLFCVEKYDCNIARFDNYEKIMILKEKIVTLFNTIPKDENLDKVFSNVNIWFNSHSS